MAPFACFFKTPREKERFFAKKFEDARGEKNDVAGGAFSCGKRRGKRRYARGGFKKARQCLPFLRACLICSAAADEKRAENDSPDGARKSETVFHFFVFLN